MGLMFFQHFYFRSQVFIMCCESIMRTSRQIMELVDEINAL
jgi:hypothetical protein